MEDTTVEKSTLPLYGVSAAAFAAVLVIANLQPFDKAAEISARYFAAGIPCWLASVALSDAIRVVFKMEAPEFLVTLLANLKAGFGAISQVLCALGFYWMFRHISLAVGHIFLIVALPCYFGVAIASLVPISILSKRHGQSNGQPRDHTNEVAEQVDR